MADQKAIEARVCELEGEKTRVLKDLEDICSAHLGYYEQLAQTSLNNLLSEIQAELSELYQQLGSA